MSQVYYFAKTEHTHHTPPSSPGSPQRIDTWFDAELADAMLEVALRGLATRMVSIMGNAWRAPKIASAAGSAHLCEPPDTQ
jgi:hypothetical protein